MLALLICCKRPAFFMGNLLCVHYVHIERWYWTVGGPHEIRDLRTERCLWCCPRIYFKYIYSIVVYISWWYFSPYISYWSPRYIFSYINLSWGWYFHIYYLSTKQSETGCFIFHYSLKAAVMTKQTNNCAGSSWHLKMFLRLACNHVLMSSARAPSWKQLGFAYVLAATI